MTAKLLYRVGELAFLDALEIIQLVELTEAQNRGRIVAHLNDAGAARAGIVIKNALISRIVLLVAGAYAPVRKDDMHLHQAFKLLEDPATRKIAADHGDAAMIESTEERWRLLQTDPRQSLVKHFRDKHTAHKGAPKPGVPPPSYGDFFSFALETAALMEALAQALGGTEETLDEHRDEVAGAAFAFWRPWD